MKSFILITCWSRHIHNYVMAASFFERTPKDLVTKCGKEGLVWKPNAWPKTTSFATDATKCESILGPQHHLGWTVYGGGRKTVVSAVFHHPNHSV